jgi:hypothetical protein
MEHQLPRRCNSRLWDSLGLFGFALPGCPGATLRDFSSVAALLIRNRVRRTTMDGVQTEAQALA